MRPTPGTCFTNVGISAPERYYPRCGDERDMLNDPSGQPILVVDDEMSVREILAEGLDCMGYQVVTASSAAEAFETILANPRREFLQTKSQCRRRRVG